MFQCSLTCVFLFKKNIKCILVIMFLLVVFVRNWVFCVYGYTDEFLCVKNIFFTVNSSKCHNKLVMGNNHYNYLEGILVSEDGILEHLCIETRPKRVGCKELTLNQTFSETPPDISLDACLNIKSTDNSFIYFEIFYIFKNKQNNMYSKMICKLHQDGNVSSVDIKMNSNHTNSNTRLINNIYCLYQRNGTFHLQVSLACSDPSYGKTNYIADLQKVYDYLLLVFAILLHIITLSVFLLVPRLQAGYGRAVMSYVSAQMIRKVLVIVMIAILGAIHEFQEFTIYGAMYFSCDLTAHMWQIIITFQIWKAFRSKRLRSSGAMPLKTFFIISVFTWGVPCTLMTIYFIVSELFLSDEIYWVPASFGEIAVLVLLEVAAMTLSAATLVQLRASRTGCGSLKGTESKRHNTTDVQWGSLYMKIVLLAGVDYVFVMMFFLVDNLLLLNYDSLASEILYYVMWDLYNMRGVEMMFIFVLKQDVWKTIKKRFGMKQSTTNT